MIKNISLKKRNYIVGFGLMLVLMMLFVKSFYWPENGWESRKILLKVLTPVVIVVLPLVTVWIPALNNAMTKCIHKICNWAKQLWNNRVKAIAFIVSTLITTLLSYMAVRVIYTMILGMRINYSVFYLVLAIGYIVLFTFWLRKSIATKPELLFVAIVMILGTLFIKVSPAQPGVSWDDQIHYERTLNVSNIFNGVMYQADMTIIGDTYVATPKYGNDEKAEYVQALEQSYANKQIVPYTFNQFGIWSVAYIPSAIGILLGRALSLSFVHTYMLGKFFCLSLYAFLFYLAIKKVRYGKVLLAGVGLIPTSIFLATAYSYDSWVIGFIALGMAYFASILQSDAKKVNAKDYLIMVVLIVVGCLPKAVYFPILCPLLLLPMTKFINKKQRNICYFIVILGILFLVASFILPILLNGAGQGDIRGGADVNSAEQIKYILHNPLTYTDTLLKFLSNYLALENTSGYLQAYAYMGIGNYWGIVLVTLFVLAYTDSNRCEGKTNIIRVGGIISAWIAIVFVATALYIAYTPVGDHSIAGCQLRYMLPLIFPVLYFIGSNKVTNVEGRKAYVVIPLYIMAMTFLYNIYTLCIAYY